MTATARQLFEVLREKLRTLDSDVIEMAEQRSVSYHGPAFFLEVLPRKNRIGLLLSLDFNEVEDRVGVAQDASQWKFIVNALYEGGVYVDVDTEADVDKALPLVHQAREIART